MTTMRDAETVLYDKDIRKPLFWFSCAENVVMLRWSVRYTMKNLRIFQIVPPFVLVFAELLR